MEQPVIYWTPSIAPSGMAFYTGARIPVWHGDLFVGALNITTDATDGRILRLGPP